MIQNIEVSKLHPHPHNPRKDLGNLNELAESIKERGVLQNLTVVPMEAVDPDATIKLGAGHYVVVIGHRRLEAAKIAGLTEVPCAVVEMDEHTQIATMLLENIQRTDLTILEQAEGFQMMIDLGETVGSISKKTGFSKTTIQHRIKLNELDKKKLMEASSRGGRLEDYISLEKIKSAKSRNKVLEAIGTGNFDWSLKNALEEQEKPERRKALIAELDKFAKPIKDNETKDLAYVDGFYNFEGEVKEPKDADKIEYFYTVDQYKATLYKKEPKAVQRKTAKEKAFGKRESQLKALSKRAYQLRLDFVKNFDAAKKYSAEINVFAFKRLLRYGSADLNNIIKFLGIEKPEGEDYSSEVQELKRSLIFQKYREQPEKTMLIVAYVSFDDKPSNDYYFAQSWNSFKIEHEENSVLDDLYDGLISIGYQMSDEERALKDGTHELFDQPKQEDHDEKQAD